MRRCKNSQALTVQQALGPDDSDIDSMIDRFDHLAKQWTTKPREPKANSWATPESAAFAGSLLAISLLLLKDAGLKRQL